MFMFLLAFRRYTIRKHTTNVLRRDELSNQFSCLLLIIAPKMKIPRRKVGDEDEGDDDEDEDDSADEQEEVPAPPPRKRATQKSK